MLLRLCGQQLFDDFFGLPRRAIEAQVSIDLGSPVRIIVVAFAHRIGVRNVASGESFAQILRPGTRPVAITGIEEDAQFVDRRRFRQIQSDHTSVAADSRSAPGCARPRRQTIQDA